ncbi:unnamed protein product [Brachionus calyciflorus]|uniref:Uncharacterized protein n=1 Tax=Brachionus calyciflorus TaxID=104777 RepID=A0A814BSM4_9BILA|nr:unnamed protein product [Brachionus calyciflorus]
MEPNSLLNEAIHKDIKRIFELHEKRVFVYNEFEIRFKEYLLDAPSFNSDKLQSICKEIGDQMNIISQEILGIKSNFSPQVYNQKKLFNLVEKIQDLEQNKFKKTLEFYINEQQRLEKLADTDEFELVFKDNQTQMRKGLNDIKLEINECLEEMRYELYENL